MPCVRVGARRGRSWRFVIAVTSPWRANGKRGASNVCWQSKNNGKETWFQNLNTKLANGLP